MLLHNLRHQGVFPPSSFDLLGLDGPWYSALEWQYPPDQRMGAYEEEGRAINTLKGAITTADRIVAVSPGAQPPCKAARLPTEWVPCTPPYRAVSNAAVLGPARIPVACARRGGAQRSVCGAHACRARGSRAHCAALRRVCV
jgi:Starch synthase catalytic domain